MSVFVTDEFDGFDAESAGGFSVFGRGLGMPVVHPENLGPLWPGVILRSTFRRMRDNFEIHQA